MNLLTSLALLGFVSRALAHAQLVMLSEMQQENSTNSKSPYAPSHLPLMDAVSTEFTRSIDETISDLQDPSNGSSNDQEGPSESSNSSSSSPSNERPSIPSGATQLPGLHGRTPLIWRWNEAINQTINQNRLANRRVQRKSNDFAPRSAAADCTKSFDERSNQRIPDDENDRAFTSGDGNDETLNQRTGAGDRRSSSGSRNRHNNRGSSENRFDQNERRRESDLDDIDGNDDNSDSNESTSFSRRRNQNRRRPNKNNDGDSDEVDERDGNYRQDEDEEKLDRRRDSTDDDSYDDDDDENDSRVSSTSSRRSNNRNRGYNRNYGPRRRHQGYRGDGESNYQKPYGKRPNYSELPNKPYPKDNTPQSSRRVKNHKKTYSAPRPAGFPNVNSPSNGADANSFGPVNANTQFITLSGESPDDLINLEDGATILDTHTGQTYELSIADSRSSPIISYPQSESADRVPYASLKSNYERPAGASLDSLLQTLLIRSNQQGLIVEPVAA